MLPPQAEGKEGPGEVAGCGARLEALDLNHANLLLLLMSPFLVSSGRRIGVSPASRRYPWDRVYDRGEPNSLSSL